MDVKIKRDATLYVRIKPVNKAFVETLSVAKNYSESEFMDAWLDEERVKQNFTWDGTPVQGIKRPAVAASATTRTARKTSKKVGTKARKATTTTARTKMSKGARKTAKTLVAAKGRKNARTAAHAR